MAVFSEGRWGQPERNNFEVGGHGGVPRLNLQFYRMAVFYEEPGMHILFYSVSRISPYILTQSNEMPKMQDLKPVSFLIINYVQIV